MDSDVTHAPLEQALVKLNDGRIMPQLGFGTWRVREHEAEEIVGNAIAAGYRAIDTASIYKNEEAVGRAIAAAAGDVPRDELFVTTKLWNADQGYDTTLSACEASLKRLGLDHVDLYLMHWPMPGTDRFVDTWKAMIRLRDEGRARSIGVSNFRPTDLERIIDDTGVKPTVNQIELHPRFQQVELRGWLDENDIKTQSWSPLGQNQILGDPVIGRVAEKHGRTPAQVVIRWHLDQGIIVIPKASTPAHMVDNLAVGGFALDADDMAAIAALDDADGRLGPDPSNYEDQ